MENGKQGAFAMLNPNGSFTQYGLTKREYFASMAIQGILSNPKVGMTYSPSFVSSLAVIYADALLAELDKTKLE